MDPLGVTRYLGTDDAGSIAMVSGAGDTAYGIGIEQLDFERAGARAIMRAGRMRVRRIRFGHHSVHFARLTSLTPALQIVLFQTVRLVLELPSFANH